MSALFGSIGLFWETKRVDSDDEADGTYDLNTVCMLSSVYF
jgi:hypothetical protein